MKTTYKGHTGAVLRIVLFGLAAVLLTAALLVGINTPGGGSFWNWGWGGRYEQLLQTREFDAAEVTALDIDWIDGRVVVSRGEAGQPILCRELAPAGEENTAELLQCSLTDGVLTLRQTGRLRWHFLSFGWGDARQLEIVLPAELARLKVHTTSADVQVAADAQQIALSTVSGDLRLAATSETVRTVSASSTSSDVDLAAPGAESVTLHSVSGNLRFTGGSERLDVSTVSGDVRLRAGICPRQLEAKTTSGNIRVTLPKGSAFDATYSRVSGNFSSTFAGLSGKNRFTTGDAADAAAFKFATVSGNITVDSAG